MRIGAQEVEQGRTAGADRLGYAEFAAARARHQHVPFDEGPAVLFA